jgi:hypothetical protein
MLELVFIVGGCVVITAVLCICDPLEQRKRYFDRIGTDDV